jgi:hypothetical protein
MNYFNIYWKIILRAKTNNTKNNVLYEIHHIIPRSEGGINKKTNKVNLTLKEHHLCHLLLIKMGLCLSYLFSNYTLRQYVNLKMKEKNKFKVKKK